MYKPLPLPFPIPKLIGHRGVTGTAPENTLAAIRHAKEAGCEWVEFDVRVTKDDQLVVHHDSFVDRCSNGSGKVRDLSLAQLRALDSGSWFDMAFKGEPIASFAEVLELCKELSLGINVEIKSDRYLARHTARLVEAQMREAWPAKDLAKHPALISSFKRNALLELKEIGSPFPRGLLVHRPFAGWQSLAVRAQVSTFHVSHRHLNLETIEQAKQMNLAIMTYSVDEASVLKSMHALGVQSIITGEPENLGADVLQGL